MVLVDILVFFFPPQINRIRSSLSVLDTTREVHWGVVTSPPPSLDSTVVWLGVERTQQARKNRLCGRWEV